MMDFHAISPFVRIAFNSYIKAPWHLKRRVIFDYELLYIKKGNVEIGFDHRIYHGTSGDIFLFRPGVHHYIKTLDDTPFHQPHMHFDLFEQSDSTEVGLSFQPAAAISAKELSHMREDNIDLFGISFPDKINLQNLSEFERMLFAIIEEFEHQLPLYKLRAKAMCLDLLIYLARHLMDKACAQQPRHQALEDVFAYMKDNYTKDISLHTLAKMADMSKYHFTRKYTAHFHVTPMRHIQNLRLQKAKELISFTNLSLTEIAELAGFSCIHSFSRAYKNAYGVMPSSLRK